MKDQVTEYEIDKFDAVVKLMDCLVVSLDEELGGDVTNVVRPWVVVRSSWVPCSLG